MTDRLDLVLDGATADGRVPGVVAMAATADGVIYQGASGMRDIATKVPMTSDSVFWLASMTKAVTSVAAMQLVEQGLLALDAPVAEILPLLASPQVLDGFDAAGAAILRPARTTMTLRHLLTHTSGYGYEVWNADLIRAHQAMGLPPRAEDWAGLAREPLLFDPGTDWNYSIATDVVGKVVEAVSGLSLADYFTSHIFTPLGMHETMFAANAAMKARFVTVHARQPDGSAVATDYDPTAQLGFLNGGGGLRGTASDYIRFLRMLLAGGTLDGARILAPATVAMMGQNHIGELIGRPMRSVVAHLSQDADFFPGMAQKWGLGFLLNTQVAPSGRSAGGMAWAGLGNTYFWIDPVRGVAGVVLAQILPFADPVVLELLWAFERGVYDTM
jgi:CubicO group peptidase (beta-lactamase class C family)